MPHITTGERIGYDRGKVEEREAIARNMLNDNLPLETIARFTGLTISELEGFANDQLQQLQTQSE
jgi:predicted transposase YdaD